ncbi:MarR family winged helix-turn-helix transcriptional regulator [Methanospirillum lacunae]
MVSPDQSARDLYQIWMRIMNKLNESESIPRKFGVDVPLYPSEIHTLQVIGDHPQANVRTVAEHLGITPGAASQMISKLSKRELVTKVRGLKNEKEVHLELTPSGITAYQAHETIHEMVFQKIVERIGPLSSDQNTFLEHVLHAVESVYDERIETVRNEMKEQKTRKEGEI